MEWKRRWKIRGRRKKPRSWSLGTQPRFRVGPSLFYLGKTHLKLPFPREDRCSNKPNRPLACSSRVFRAAGKCGDPARKKRKKGECITCARYVCTCLSFVIGPVYQVQMNYALSPLSTEKFSCELFTRENSRPRLKDTSELYLFS